jgi:hypothetical protein
MKLICYISAGLLAIPIISCLPVAGTVVKAVPEEEAVSVFEYGTYKKREAGEDTPTIFGYLYKEREVEKEAPNVFEYGTY